MVGSMASGHVNRIERTWLHRPGCSRKESYCLLGAVHPWHEG